jgi:hypothetical protein
MQQMTLDRRIDRRLLSEFLQAYPALAEYFVGWVEFLDDAQLFCMLQLSLGHWLLFGRADVTNEVN